MDDPNARYPSSMLGAGGPHFASTRRGNGEMGGGFDQQSPGLKEALGRGQLRPDRPMSLDTHQGRISRKGCPMSPRGVSKASELREGSIGVQGVLAQSNDQRPVGIGPFDAFGGVHQPFPCIVSEPEADSAGVPTPRPCDTRVGVDGNSFCDDLMLEMARDPAANPPPWDPLRGSPRPPGQSLWLRSYGRSIAEENKRLRSASEEQRQMRAGSRDRMSRGSARSTSSTPRKLDTPSTVAPGSAGSRPMGRWSSTPALAGDDPSGGVSTPARRSLGEASGLTTPARNGLGEETKAALEALLCATGAPPPRAGKAGAPRRRSSSLPKHRGA